MLFFYGNQQSGAVTFELLRNTERGRATRAATSAARRSPDLPREGDWQLVAKIFGARAH